MLKSLYINKFDCFVRYLDIPGTGKPRLFLPGLATTSLSLLETAIASNTISNRLLLIDYPGTLMSDPDHSFNHKLEDYVYCIKQVLDHEEILQVDIVGHSMGGTIGIQLALEFPSLVRKLVICEANIEPGGGVGTSTIASYTIEDYQGRIYPDYMKNLREQALTGNNVSSAIMAYWKNASIKAIHQGSVMLVNLPQSFKRQFLYLDIPTTFVYGEHNLPDKTGKAMPDLPDTNELGEAGINIELVPQSGHIMMVDNPDGFVRAIINGLAYETPEF